MKSKPITTSLILIALLLVLPDLSQAQAPFKSKQNKVTVQGSSSLHDWESDVTQVECKGIITVENNRITEIKDVQVKIPVMSIKSTKGRIMDNKTYEAFNAEKNPTIQYKLIQSKIEGSGEYMVTATGNLTMAGVTRPVELAAKARLLSNGDVQITGSRKLNLKDFKMVPPTAMMGTIKVGEEVTVNFEILLTPENKLTATK